MRRGERAAWEQVATAARTVTTSRSHAEEYLAKMALRAAWMKLNGIEGVSGLPRSGAKA